MTQGSIFLIAIIACLTLLIFWDLFQKNNSILRTFPIIGHFRSIAEFIGVFLRQFFYARDREELPFNRAERTWVREAADNKDTLLGFGSTRDRKPVGSIYFVDAPFPVLAPDSVKPRPVTIGPHCRNPYTTASLINISAMSFGAISKNAIRALSRGAKKAGCWLNTGEGGLSPYHLEGGCDLVVQIGTAKYGCRDLQGNLSSERLREITHIPQVKMFEIKLSQGAKPGTGGLLPGIKVTPEIATIRNITPYEDAVSPNRFPEISNSSELLDFINHIRNLTGKPTGFKIVLGNYEWLHEFCEEVIRRGTEQAPDFITLDGSEGGTGAAPLSLADYMGLPITESLPILIDVLKKYHLRDRIKVIAAGKLITPDNVVWALAVGADFVNSARGFMFALGCVQALKCHKNTCPTGITTHNPWLTRGLDASNKANKVFHYVKNLEYEVGMICHSCGVNEPRELTRDHVRIVTESGISVSLRSFYEKTRERQL